MFKRATGSTLTAGVLAVIVVLAVVGAAQAAAGGERSAVAFPAGTFQIDAASCRFTHPEADRPLGRSWVEGRVAFAYEDGRHDALDSCLRKRGDRMAACWKAAPPLVTEAPADVKGYHDVIGAAALRAYLAGVQSCERQAAGI